MKTSEALLKILGTGYMRLADLARLTGLPYSTLWERIHQDNITVHKLHDVIQHLDYDIVLIPKDTERQPDWYRIE